MRKTGRVLTLLLLLAMVLHAAPSFALTQIMNVRKWTAPDHTRVVIDTSDEPKYSVEKSSNKVSIGFESVTIDNKIRSEFIVNKTGLVRVAIRSLPDDAARVEFLLTEGAETKVFYLEQIQDKPHRVVIDIWLPDVEKKQSEEREQVKTRIKDKIIVIDPGHGGDDPGAIGKGGTREKDVVLSLGMKLKDVLNKKKGYRAFLTREGDYYVTFKKRLQMAREYGADLFISVHADAARNRAARGSSVYCLSLGGASSEAAKIMARNENLADIIGGAESSGENDESDPIVLNMFQTNTINQSKTFGHCLLGNLQEVSPPKSSRVQEAPFRVLKLPEIPALLMETAYISNPREEKLLASRTFQNRVARAVAASIAEFLQSAPTASIAAAASPSAQPSSPPASEQAAEQPAAQPAAQTAAQPAARAVPQPAVQVAPQPAPAAEARSSAQAAVKKKKAAALKEEDKPEPAPTVYRVRKGDTLAKIAASNKVPLGRLLKLNRMRLDSPLYVGREIKLETGEKTLPVKIGKSAGPAKTASRASSGKGASATRVYRVKNGDTLAKVASKHKTTIAVLLKLNHMRLSDPLFVDQKLILPRKAAL